MHMHMYVYMHIMILMTSYFHDGVVRSEGLKLVGRGCEGEAGLEGDALGNLHVIPLDRV